MQIEVPQSVVDLLTQAYHADAEAQAKEKALQALHQSTIDPLSRAARQAREQAVSLKAQAEVQIRALVASVVPAPAPAPKPLPAPAPEPAKPAPTPEPAKPAPAPEPPKPAPTPSPAPVPGTLADKDGNTFVLPDGTGLRQLQVNGAPSIKAGQLDLVAGVAYASEPAKPGETPVVFAFINKGWRRVAKVGDPTLVQPPPAQPAPAPKPPEATPPSPAPASSPAPAPASPPPAAAQPAAPQKDAAGNTFEIGTMALVDGNFQLHVNGSADGEAKTLTLAGGVMYASRSDGSVYAFQGTAWNKVKAVGDPTAAS